MAKSIVLQAINFQRPSSSHQRVLRHRRIKARVSNQKGFTRPLTLLFIVGAGLIAVLLVAAVVGWYGYKNTALPLTTVPLDFKLAKGSGARQLAISLNQKGISVSPTWLWLVTRLRGDGAQLKAGTYRLTAPITLEQLLNKIVKGDVLLSEIRFIEGWTFAQMRREIDKHPDLRHDSIDMSEPDLMKKIGSVETKAEGWFMPSTYSFPPGSSDFEVYRQAYTLMNKSLLAAWEKRAPNLPIKSPYELLILASLIEKETGRDSDRDKVAAVFINRLRIHMMLQSDPTTIYGMGDAFKGNIRRKDLQTDTPYNTYTRFGLTPTPIALPGKASLMAATKPAEISALYFVARGDGSSEFSDNLADHNRAVAKFQLGK